MTRAGDGWFSLTTHRILTGNPQLYPQAADSVDVESGAADWTGKVGATTILAGGTIPGPFVITHICVSCNKSAGTSRKGDYELRIWVGASWVASIGFTISTDDICNLTIPVFIGGYGAGLDESGDIAAFLLYSDASGSGASTVGVKVMAAAVYEL